MEGGLLPAAGRDDDGEGRVVARALELDDGVERPRPPARESEAPERDREAELVAVRVADDLVEPRAAERGVEVAASLRPEVARYERAVDERRAQRGVRRGRRVGRGLPLEGVGAIRQRRPRPERSHLGRER